MRKLIRRATAFLVGLFLFAAPAMALDVKQASTSIALTFQMVSTTDGTTGVTGLTPTVTLSKNGAAFAAPTGTVAEIANGWYKLTPSAADTGTVGNLILHATGTGAYATDQVFAVVAYDPTSAANLGLTALPGTGTLAVSPSVTVATGGLGFPAFTADAVAMLSARGYLATTGGAATSPVTADAEWAIGGLYTTTTGALANVPYYVAKTLGLYAWNDGTSWYITSTAPGVTLPAGYFKTASGATVVGPYTAQGTATGTPTVVYHGNSILNAAQPNVATLGAAIGPVALATAQNVATVAGLAPPTNWASMLISGGGAVTVGTNTDKTGYSLATASYIATGTIVAGSTTSAVVVSGLTAGKTYVGQHLYYTAPVGEGRVIASQSFSGGNYTFNLTGTAGTVTGPFSSVTTGDVIKIIP